MTLTPFREYYLIEAVDLDRTWATHKDKIMARSQEISGYEGEEKITDPTGRYTETEKRQVHPSTLTDGRAAKMHPGVKEWRPMYRDKHMVATIMRQPKPPASDGPISAALNDTDYHESVKKDAFMDVVQKAAPHPKYIPTITKMYANGSIKKIEDIGTQAADVFAKYHALSLAGKLNPKLNTHGVERRADRPWGATPGDGLGEWGAAGPDRQTGQVPKGPVHTDFRSMQTIDQVRDVVNHHSYHDFFKQESKAALKGQFSVVHDDDQVTVYHPHTWEASKHLAHCPHSGRKVAWCTAANSDDAKETFESYSKDGPLLIFHPKKPRREGELYQSHINSGQHMDEHDEPSNFLHGRVPTEREVREGAPRARASARFKNVSLAGGTAFGPGPGQVKESKPGEFSVKKYTYDYVIDNPDKHDDVTWENDSGFHDYLHHEAARTKPLGEDHPERQRWRRAHSRYFPDEVEAAAKHY